MRPKRLLIPLALLTPLVLASPAAAFDWSTEVIDFEIKPAKRQIAVGDSVSEGTNSAASRFTKVFDTPGRYQYICTPHRTFMKGVVQVGTHTVVDTLDNFRSARRGNRVKLSFLLNEPATVTYRLKGPSPRTVRRGRLDDGTHSFTVRRLKRGTYRGVLTVVDDFDNKVTAKNFFVIR